MIGNRIEALVIKNEGLYYKIKEITGDSMTITRFAEAISVSPEELHCLLQNRYSCYDLSGAIKPLVQILCEFFKCEFTEIVPVACRKRGQKKRPHRNRLNYVDPQRFKGVPLDKLSQKLSLAGVSYDDIEEYIPSNWRIC